jgi:hypothetical protein
VCWLVSISLLGVLYVESVEVSKMQPQEHSNRARYLRKSHSSAAASISACHAFLPCPTMVAAMISYRYFVDIRSAALRKTAARSANGRLSQAFLASRASSMALLTSAVLALEYFATTSACDEGLCCVRIEEFVIFQVSANQPDYLHEVVGTYVLASYC